MGLLTISLLAGCSIPGLGGKEETNNTPQKIKVLYYDESSFYQEYGMLYSALNPNVEIEVVSTNAIYNKMNENNEKSYDELYAEFVEETKPDVIITDSYYMPKLIENGLLYDLDAYVNREDYDLQGLGTAVIDYMKELGNGILYGIPTTVQSQVLFYNKDVFDEYGISYPTDNMTWSEVINLASMFPTDGEYPDRVYGLKYSYSSSVADLISQMSSEQGLQQYDPETLKMTMDTPAWKDVAESALTLSKSGMLYSDELRWNYQSGDYTTNFDYYSLEPILNGIVAMAYESSYYLNQLREAKNYSQNPESLTDNWDIVSAPVGANGNNASSGTYYGNVLSMSSNSTNLDVAWDFLSYVTGDEFARVKSFSNYGNLPIRKKYAIKDSTKNIEAFYATKPMTNNQYNYDYTKIPQRFLNEFYSIQYQEFQKLQDGTATVDEVFATLQLKGEELLATGVMTEEELQKYYNELYGEDGMNYGISTRAEEIVEEEVEVLE